MTDSEAPDRIWATISEDRGGEDFLGTCWTSSRTHETQYVRADLFAAIKAERDAMRKASRALIGIVEGVKGAMEHGTWRAERSNLRMKDTDEWVAFYNATRAALEGQE